VSYAVKEMFLTLQGEGANSGRTAVFIRFAGCNLWTGRSADRGRGEGVCSAWCDTDFVGTDGTGGGRYAAPEDLAYAARRLWPVEKGPAFAVCTGGEPALQVDSDLVYALKGEGFEIAIETNGTQPLPKGLDWVCVSPKGRAPLRVTQGDELKLVYPQADADPTEFEQLDFQHFFVQPLDGPSRTDNLAAAVAFCLAHPRWRLSLQTHKLSGIP